MKRLRIILQHNTLYVLLLILILVITMFRLNIKKNSIYDTNTNKIEGVISSYKADNGKTKLIIKSKEDILGYYYSDKISHNIKFGDKVVVTGKLSKIKENKTNGLFDYKEYMERRNIYFTMNINKIYLIKRNSNLIYYLKNKINSYKNPYIKAFIVGDTSNINKDTLLAYRNLGISHLFAISGMHISFISGLLLLLLKRMKMLQRYLIVSLFLIFYLFLTGFNPSILRAVIFFVLFSCNQLFSLKITSIKILIITFFISLIINPFYVYEISFQYSFIISFFLLSLGSYIKNKGYIYKVFITSLISIVSSFPITIYNFNQINILSILYNIIYVPIISFIIYPVTIIVFFVPVCNIILDKLTYLLELSVNLFNSFDTLLIFKSLPLFFYIIYYIFIVIFFISIIKSKKIPSVFLILMIIFHYFVPYFDKSDYMVMIDVGQGDSILIHSNNKTVLVDTGGIVNYRGASNYSIALNTTIPLLKKYGIRKIDYLILTHGDFDHAGETLNLIGNYKVDKIYLNLGTFNELEEEIIENHKKTYQLQEGQVFKVGDIALMELNKEFKDENDSSSIFLMIYKDLKILLTGDASKGSERYILDNYDLGQIDILKVGHHGSKTSTSDELLEATNPKLALISCGLNNRFKHPHKDTIEKLKKSNVNYLRTDEEGSIAINFNTKKIITGGIG